ncbi:hypothetical protein EIP91_002547 [Steccherinum ochraceum]|uniref:Uncharacterized protein n=1 Tax=Steccherinum ochraceum TaxID=92696 RepID=A0A4R0RKE7_9APHY|nr:hypothetical protein EIP91_002547 [Steccherinum ochraceum]
MSSSMSFSSKVRLLFRTPMLPEDPSKAMVEVQLEDLSNSPKKAAFSHSRSSSRSSISSFSSELIVPSFMPSAITARQISQGSMKTHYSPAERGSFFGFEDSSS